MARVEVVDTLPEHIRELADNVSPADIEMAKRIGIKPMKGLWKSYRRSLYSRTMLINGEILAIWGLVGVCLGGKGYPWLITSPVAEEYPFKIAFRYRQELKEMLQYFPVLVEIADTKHEKSLRMLKLMGFTFGEMMPYGKNGELFIRAEKR